MSASPPKADTSSAVSVILGSRCSLGSVPSLAGPTDRGVMSVLAGIIPAHAVIAKRIPRRPHGERQPVRANRMAGARPRFSTWMHGRQRIDSHVQDVRNFCETLLAFDSVSDWYFFTPRFLEISGAKAAMGPPAAPVKIAPSASVCLSSAR